MPFAPVPQNFNPRPPCGGRPARCWAYPQPTTTFQSTPPVRGATMPFKYSLKCSLTFQSTLPVRGATAPQDALHHDGKISIHAPRAGSDLISYILSGVSRLFQSTLPVRGATDHRAHAYAPTRNFNPRSPCGERRVYICLKGWSFVDFNPRSPCGERRISGANQG